MGVVTDLPIRESTNPRHLDPPDFVTVQMPTFRQWIKAGFAFTVGSILAVSLAWVLYALFLLNILLGVFSGLRR